MRNLDKGLSRNNMPVLFMMLMVFFWGGCTTASKKATLKTPESLALSQVKTQKTHAEKTSEGVADQEDSPEPAPREGKPVQSFEALVSPQVSQKKKAESLTALPENRNIEERSSTKKEIALPTSKITGGKSKSFTGENADMKVRDEPISNLALNFDNADIYEVIKTIAGILDLNYIIDPAVKGTVNIHTKGMILKQDLYDIFQAILKINGATAVKEGDLTHIIPTQSAKTRLLMPTIAQGDVPSQDKVILQVVYLNYISASEAANALRPFITQGAEITVYEKNNLLLITDFSKNLQKLGKIVTLLDVNLFERAQLKLFPLEEADAQEVAQELQKIFSALNVPASSGKGVGVNIIPIKRMNALLVITSLPQALEEVEKWLIELDKTVTTVDERTFIYHVKNGIAGELADIINAVFSTRGTKRRTPTQKRRPAPFVKRSASKKPTSKDKRRPIAQQANLQSESRVTGDIKVIPYATTNTIIIKASPRDHRAIMEVLRELDTLQRQVLIEILVAELTLNDEMSLGIEAASIGSTAPSRNGEVVQKNLVGTLFGLPSPGNLVSGLTASTIQRDFQAVFNALATENRINVLASPHIIAADGKEATIDIGDEVPLIASKIFIDNREEVTIERRNTGVILKVNPHINVSGLVTLDISLELSDAAEAAVEGETDIRIFKRKANTTMVVQDGQTILIGGLINEKKEEISSKVPFFGDIPIIGWLFRSQKDSTTKTELILLITPHVIQSLDDANAVTNEFVAGLEKIHNRIKASRQKPLL